jgi:hypothetical protein
VIASHRQLFQHQEQAISKTFLRSLARPPVFEFAIRLFKYSTVHNILQYATVTKEETMKDKEALVNTIATIVLMLSLATLTTIATIIMVKEYF